MNENFAKRLRYCTTLPSLPSVAIRIIDLANNPDANMAQISDQVALNPALYSANRSRRNQVETWNALRNRQ